MSEELKTTEEVNGQAQTEEAIKAAADPDSAASPEFTEPPKPVETMADYEAVAFKLWRRAVRRMQVFYDRRYR